MWDSFETFFELQTKESLQQLKTKFSDFRIKYTPINTSVEANQMFIKVLNPLAGKLHKKGGEKGCLSRSMITYDKIVYNQTNRGVIEKSVSFGDKNQWTAQFDWLIDVMIRMKKTFKKYL